MTYYLLPFCASFILAAILTAVLRVVGLKYNLVSLPRKRDIHQKPIPRIGGLAIFLSFLLVSLFVFLIADSDLSFDSRLDFFDTHFWGIIIGSILITGVMFLDDLYNLKALTKLSAQIFVALIIIASGVGIDFLTNPFGDPISLNSVYIPLFEYDDTIYHFSLWSDLLTLVWLVGMMNVLNFIDGVDGLAAGQSVIAALVIFLLSVSMAVAQPATAMISIILAGASLGFLVWNFPPAKIFMGDSGSMFLGFMLGVLPLISGGKLATAFLVLGFPIVDGLMVAFGRIVKGKNPLTSPDKTHLHHRFLFAGFSQRSAVLSLYAIAAAFGWVSLRATTMNKIYASVALVLLLMILTVALSLVAKKRNRAISQ